MKIEYYCANCGNEWTTNNPNEEYCPECGAQIKENDNTCEICYNEMDETYTCIICGKKHCTFCNSDELSTSKFKVCVECAYQFDSKEDFINYIIENELDEKIENYND